MFAYTQITTCAQLFITYHLIPPQKSYWTSGIPYLSFLKKIWKVGKETGWKFLLWKQFTHKWLLITFYMPNFTVIGNMWSYGGSSLASVLRNKRKQRKGKTRAYPQSIDRLLEQQGPHCDGSKKHPLFLLLRNFSSHEFSLRSNFLRLIVIIHWNS